LPVLTRILGRQRNMLRLPGGQQRWPSFGHGDRPESLPPFQQFQLVQRSLEEIEIRFVGAADFGPAECAQVESYLQETLGHPFRFVFRRVGEIPRSAGGKFEDFKSELEPQETGP